jgi:tetratricopeptide (TPR) repeat protein
MLAILILTFLLTACTSREAPATQYPADATGESVAADWLDRDPFAASTLLLLDETLAEFRRQSQFYLLNQWTSRCEGEHPETPLSLSALAWRAWMLPPDRIRTADHEALQDRLKKESYLETWKDLWTRRSDEISGILAARLALASRQKDVARASLEEIAEASPDGGIAALLQLQGGLEDYRQGEFKNAVDRILAGIEHYPILWEISEWRALAAEALRAEGHRVQAAFFEEGGPDPHPLREYRRALNLKRTGQFEEALEILGSLRPPTAGSGDFERLVEAEARLLKGGPEGSQGSVLLNLSGADVPEVSRILSTTQEASLTAEDLLGIAALRSDRGENEAAVLLWRAAARRGNDSPVPTAIAYRHLLDYDWARIAVIRELRDTLPQQGFMSVLRRDTGTQLETLGEEQEDLLDEAEIFCASAELGLEVFQLTVDLYIHNSRVGREDRPNNLFVSLAKRGGSEWEQRILTEARWLSPEEGVAIVRGAQGENPEPLLSMNDEWVLGFYEEEEQWKEAAEVAKAIAQSATDSLYGRQALYKAAWLEYQAADYRTAEATLKELLEKAPPNSEEYARTTRLLGLANFQTGDQDEARAYFNQALESDLLSQPEREEIGLLQVHSFLTRQEYNQAAGALREMLDQQPSSATERRIRSLLNQIGAPPGPTVSP